VAVPLMLILNDCSPRARPWLSLHAGAAAQRRYARAATPKASSGGPRNSPDGNTDSS
jgi:hypothetical protein